ncbi:MAG: DNA cytosine methyltransferase [Gemmatimonadetes bacterium]|nr:DNA cytosine methyltransferase [Gemmatimonadota bacterium]
MPVPSGRLSFPGPPPCPALVVLGGRGRRDEARPAPDALPANRRRRLQRPAPPPRVSRRVSGTRPLPLARYGRQTPAARAVSNRPARLQGFPEDYLFFGSPTAVWKMIGQAVQIDAGRAILAAIAADAQEI